MVLIELFVSVSCFLSCLVILTYSDSLSWLEKIVLYLVGIMSGLLFSFSDHEPDLFILFHSVIALHFIQRAYYLIRRDSCQEQRARDCQKTHQKRSQRKRLRNDFS